MRDRPMRWVPRLPPSLNSNYPSEILYVRLPVWETLTILLGLTFSMMFSSPSFADWKKVSENVEGDLPPIVVPLPTRVLEPWTKGEAERSPEAMVLSFQELGGGSPVNCAA